MHMYMCMCICMCMCMLHVEPCKVECSDRGVAARCEVHALLAYSPLPLGAKVQGRNGQRTPVRP